MRLGTAAIVAVLLAILAASAVLAVLGWRLAADAAMPASAYVAMGLGIAFTLVIGCGLMFLVFYSGRHGYDAPPQRMTQEEAGALSANAAERDRR